MSPLSPNTSPFMSILRALTITCCVAILASCGPPVQVVPVTSVPVRAVPERAEVTVPKEVVDPEVARFEGVIRGRFDGGKMWTFDNPPLEYFQTAYGFEPDSAWFAKARSAALRLGTFCSASFVSESGLVMTNHHCARESVTEVTRAGEDLLENGFLAATPEEERKVKDLYVDQLVEIRDVTADIYAAGAKATTPTTQAAERERKVDALKAQLTREAKTVDSLLVVEIIPLYNGGKYAAYTFRRYKDVRLVMAPELQLGFFGGDWDNFTYPRYNLDVSFFRVYGVDGKPLVPKHHFSWSETGARSGDPVFVVGNPGSTSRLTTVSQLEYARDYEMPLYLDLLSARALILDGFIQSHPADADSFKLKNAYFSLQNTRKSMAGQFNGLQSDWLIPRKGAWESELRTGLASSDSLKSLYGSVLGDIKALQLSKQASIGSAKAFAFFLNPSMSSRVLSRAMYGYVYAILKQRGAPEDQLEEIKKEALAIESWPKALDKSFLALRLSELRDALGTSDASVRRLLGDMTPQEVADSVMAATVLSDSASYAALLEKGYLSSQDPTVDLIEVIAPLYFTLNQQLEGFQERESALNARLARARFALFGDSEPPDASFSLRISDGVVAPYDYNGTRAPVFTTFFGLYDRYYSAKGKEDWELPARWINPPESFDFDTPLNLVSTNDITGGNSGSPLLNSNLEVVGLVFDSNIEALPNEYLYTDLTARTISVDARGILEALRDIYGADRIVTELTGGGQ